MEIFDLKNEKWTKIKKITFDTVAFSAVLLGHKLMLIGGMKKIDIVATVSTYKLELIVSGNIFMTQKILF